MAADPDVLAALQSAHDAEATASELWHKQEHEFKVGPLRAKKLGKWFDRRHKEAADRQHDLRRHIIRLGGTVATNLGDTTYTGDVPDAFAKACDVLDDLIAKHSAIVDAANDAGDHDTVKRFEPHVKDLRTVYHKGEQKQQAIKELGLPLFLHRHS